MNEQQASQERRTVTRAQRFRQIFARVFFSTSLFAAAPGPFLLQPLAPEITQVAEANSTQEYDFSEYRLPFDGRFMITQGRSKFTIDGQDCTVQFHTTHQNLAKEAIDFLIPEGTPIRAVQNGEVVYTGWIDQYGNAVLIEHPDGLTSWYGHLSEVAVTQGEKVYRGSFLGKSGKTGTSQAHFHFEVRNKDNQSIPTPINGLQWMGGFDSSCSFKERFEGYGDHPPVFETIDINNVEQITEEN